MNESFSAIQLIKRKFFEYAESTRDADRGTVDVALSNDHVQSRTPARSVFQSRTITRGCPFLPDGRNAGVDLFWQKYRDPSKQAR
jgi:hypothetical protein